MLLLSTEPQSLRNNNRDIFLLTSSDRELSNEDSEADLSLSERERLSSSPGIRECDDGMRESLTQETESQTIDTIGISPQYSVCYSIIVFIHKSSVYLIACNTDKYTHCL